RVDRVLAMLDRGRAGVEPVTGHGEEPAARLALGGQPVVQLETTLLALATRLRAEGVGPDAGPAGAHFGVRVQFDERGRVVAGESTRVRVPAVVRVPAGEVVFGQVDEPDPV